MSYRNETIHAGFNRDWQLLTHHNQAAKRAAYMRLRNSIPYADKLEKMPHFRALALLTMTTVT
jgi:hypothetical protein